MGRIIAKRKIAPDVIWMEIEAPAVAGKARPGQFVILMTDERGERIPLTVADYDLKKGSVQIVFQIVGKTTAKLSRLDEGDELFSFVGPLGKPTDIGRHGTVVVVGGGTGIACILPIARGLKEAGNRVISIIGARTRELVIMEDEIRDVSSELLVSTDDGSHGKKGFVTQVLEEVLQREKDVKKVWAIGPAPMMRAVCGATKQQGIETIVSLNAIMVDGTGMCGTCRVTVGGKTRFTCVDGPEFNGHLVDWAEFMNRLARYKPLERSSFDAYMTEMGRCHGGQHTET